MMLRAEPRRVLACAEISQALQPSRRPELISRDAERGNIAVEQAQQRDEVRARTIAVDHGLGEADVARRQHAQKRAPIVQIERRVLARSALADEANAARRGYDEAALADPVEQASRDADPRVEEPGPARRRALRRQNVWFRPQPDLRPRPTLVPIVRAGPRAGLGQGSTLVMCVFAAGEICARADTVQVAESAHPRRGDNAALQDFRPIELLAELLEFHGYKALRAHVAAEALRLATEHQPHACVIDIGLPDMDGYELARRLRAIPQSRVSRLIALTGYGTMADHKAFEEAGFDHYFTKPPDINQLIRVLSD